MNENIQFLNGQLVQQTNSTPIHPMQSDLDYLFMSFKYDEHYYFLNQKIKEITLMYHSLRFENEAVLEICIDIITVCIQQDKIDIKISKTGENELLLYRENDSSFNNIIIDEDADIEFLHIPENRKNTYNEYYPFIYYIDIKKLADKL